MNNGVKQIVSCARRLQWNMGHRLADHEGECVNLHGHNYSCWFHARGKGLDEVGRVIDFGLLKVLIGGWIDRFWDHGVVLFRHDPLSKMWSEPEGRFSKQKHFLLDANPTTENLASYLLNEVCPAELAGTEVEVYRVVLHETENCFAEARLV